MFYLAFEERREISTS